MNALQILHFGKWLGKVHVFGAGGGGKK